VCHFYLISNLLKLSQPPILAANEILLSLLFIKWMSGKLNMLVNIQIKKFLEKENLIEM